MNASTDFPCKKTTEEVSMSVIYKICLYHIKPPYSNSLSWIRMSTACNVVILEGRIGTNGIVLTKMGSESTICVLKTCCVVLKSLSKSLKKLRLLKCGWMVKIHHLMQIVHSLLLVMCMPVSLQNYRRTCCQTFEDFLLLSCC